MIERALPIAIGIPLMAAGFGLTGAFGIFSFIGMPLLIVGLGCISAGFNPPAALQARWTDAGPTYQRATRRRLPRLTFRSR
jgi:hypothetical protein